MSDTPRTDEQINGKPCTRFEVLAGDSLRNASVPSDFARELEHELNIELERANYYRDKWQRNEQRIQQLEEALEGTVKWIVDLANSGDAGFWNPEEQPEIIVARAALKTEAKL